MRKIKKVKMGDYVLATRWCDKDPKDPWVIGQVYTHGIDRHGHFYKVGDSYRYWRNVFSITRKEGVEWLENNKDT